MPTGWTYDKLIERLVDRSKEFPFPLPAPPYHGHDFDGNRLALAVESMSRHMTDEGWQIFQALGEHKYLIAGKNCPVDQTDVHELVKKFYPTTVVLQDKREWEGRTAGGPSGFDHSETFRNVGVLKDRPDIFKLTILKDAQHNPFYHQQSANEIGCHVWICYYNPEAVCRLAPYVRREHIIRTWHTIDRNLVPPFEAYDRHGCLISGATSVAYPVRNRLIQSASWLPETTILRHPGYHRNGCVTPQYLQTLSKFKVAVCTASIYGYTLRKMVEATACGCMVLTDLPEDEVVPEINDNLTRIGPNFGTDRIRNIMREMLENWDDERQMERANRALAFFDYRIEGKRLVDKIEEMRQSYGKG